MRSNLGMANRQGDVDLREAQIDVPSEHSGLAADHQSEGVVC